LLSDAADISTSPPLLVSLDEAARLLACSRSMVKLMIRRGQIRTVKIGRLTRIPRGISTR
jgi:excisionase family DNA binding protein